MLQPAAIVAAALRRCRAQSLTPLGYWSARASDTTMNVCAPRPVRFCKRTCRL